MVAIGSGAKQREIIRPEGIPRPPVPFSPAVKAGGWVFVSGQMAADYHTGIAAEARIDPDLPFHQNASRLQSLVIWANIKKILEAAGASLEQLVRSWQWHTYREHDWSTGSCWVGVDTGRFQEVKRQFIPQKRPASTSMGIRGLLVPGALHAVDCLAIIPQRGAEKEVVVPKNVPQQLAGGALCTVVDDWVFFMGEIPTDWKGDWGSNVHYGERSSVAVEARANPYFWYDSPIEKQTEYTLKKLQAMAEACGTSLDRCVKADVYLGHPSDFAGFEKVWKSWFPKNPPARTVLFYQGLGGKGCRVEITPICLREDSPLRPQTIQTTRAAEPVAHEPQAVRVGHLLFLSGQMACDAGGLARGINRDPAFPHYGSRMKRQMRYILDNVAAICEAGGTSLENVVHQQTFYTDFESYTDAVDEWAARFPKDPPATVDVCTGGPLLVPGCDAILNLIAHVPEAS